MNANEMLDYALGQIEGPERERFEASLAADPRAAARADRLSHALGQLLDDGEAFDPPPDLARRTAQFVSDHAQRRRTILDFVPSTVPFRWADVAVAAGIFVAGLLTLLPAVQRSRDRMNQAGCAYNLQQVGRALWQYASQHNHFPSGHDQDPHAPAGGFVSVLHDARLFFDNQMPVLDCPENGAMRRHGPIPTVGSLCEMCKSDPQRVHDVMATDYAYTIGHRQASGVVVPVYAHPASITPLLADQPPHENFRRISHGNSPNHGGRGQNVLYTDLHVGWHSNRRLSPIDEDLYLNANHELAPGVNSEDAVLVPSLVPFLGW